MTTEHRPATADTLAPLADRINDSHQRFLRSLRHALAHARDTGTLLLEARARVEAAGARWLPWVQAHCQFSVSQAQRYVRIANHYHRLRAQGDDPANLSMTAALRLLSPAADQRPGDRRDRGRRIQVASRGEVKHLVRQAGSLPLPADCPERKFLDGAVAGLAQRVLARAKKSRLTDAEGQPLSPAAVALALLEQLKQTLAVELVVEVQGPEGPPPPAPTPGHAGDPAGVAPAPTG